MLQSCKLKWYLCYASNAAICREIKMPEMKKRRTHNCSLKFQSTASAAQKRKKGQCMPWNAAHALQCGWSWHPEAACTVCTGQKYLSLPVRTIWKPLWKRNTGDKLFYMLCRRRDSINRSHVMDTQVQFTTKFSMHCVCTDLIQGALWTRRWGPLIERSVVRSLVLAAWHSLLEQHTEPKIAPAVCSIAVWVHVWMAEWPVG